ncbi:MAG: hypothetical protein M3X11_00040 [Acidobacteriota bacterium]|nr:hypothetical protein [Acidobacteriota bacterium]
MKKFLSSVLILCLSVGTVAAQSAQPAKSQTTAPAKPAMVVVSTTLDELIALLPTADLIAVVDVNRLVNELVPKLANIEAGGVNKLARQVADFTTKTGIDPAKVTSAVLGFSMEGTVGTGAIIVSGLDLNSSQVEAAMKEFKTEFKTSDYKGKTIFNVLTTDKKPGVEAGPVSVKTDETALAALGNQRFVLGDLKAVKQVIDVSTGAAKSSLTPMMIEALKETRSSALLRFAINVPESLKKGVLDQGDLFKSINALQVVLGTFDVASDFSLGLDALMRTTSQKDATELEEGLKGLVSLIQSIFGGGNSDPKMEAVGQLLNQIKIGSKVNDVSLSITLPRAMLDQLMKKPAPADAKKPGLEVKKTN